MSTEQENETAEWTMGFGYRLFAMAMSLLMVFSSLPLAGVFMMGAFLIMFKMDDIQAKYFTRLKKSL